MLTSVGLSLDTCLKLSLYEGKKKMESTIYLNWWIGRKQTLLFELNQSFLSFIIGMEKGRIVCELSN